MNRRKFNMNYGKFIKNYRKTLILTLIFVLALTCCLAGCSSKSSGGEAGSSSPEQDQSPKVLEGTIEDITNGTIAVKDEEGEIYYFQRDDSLVVSPDGILEIDRNIHVTYAGELEESDNNVQDVELISFYIEKAQAEPANSGSGGHDSAEQRATEILSSLTLEEKVGQMFIVRCPEKEAAGVASKYQFGGYILFARDFKNYSREQVKANISSYQNSAKIPMFIGVDEEGGTVNRVSLYTQFRAAPFLSPRELYNQGGWSLIKSDTQEKAALLKSLGINLNFAPVADVSTDQKDYMYQRSFGVSAEKTAEFVGTVVGVMRENNMGSVLKHFPGYGNNKDTHTGIAVDERSLESFRESDFLPFKAGIEAGAPVVLVSHNIVKSMDAERPASLSSAVHNILRKELNFDGLIITDDLYMDAIRQYTYGQEAAVMAVMAGNDLLCCTDYETQYPAVVEAVESGRISQSRIDESVLRILKYKLEVGIIE